MRLIDADALMVRLVRKTAGTANKRYTDGFNDALMKFRSMISTAPTIEAETVKHGRWLDTMCSNCQKVALLEELDGDIGRITVYAYSNYCPNCGAKMDGGAE